jgi:pimeloyl-ACP methyl ester carboxylesterase
MGGYDEQAVLLGHAKSLVGVVTRPTGASFSRPSVVILNTGIVHRVGHHRMYVTMARELALAGHVVLRFDFSGIGDSSRRAYCLSPIDACLEDTREALDWLTASFSVNEVVLAGLCSGADIALRYAQADERVVGLVLLDPAIPPTARFYTQYILGRIHRPQSWLTFAQGRGRIWGYVARRIAYALGWQLPSGEVDLIHPQSRKELEQLYRNLLEGNTLLLVGLTGGLLTGRHAYREQLLDAFPALPFEGKLRVEYFADADHTFTRLQDRQRLNAIIKEWLAGILFQRLPIQSPGKRVADPTSTLV